MSEDLLEDYLAGKAYQCAESELASIFVEEYKNDNLLKRTINIPELTHPQALRRRRMSKFVSSVFSSATEIIRRELLAVKIDFAQELLEKLLTLIDDWHLVATHYLQWVWHLCLAFKEVGVVVQISPEIFEASQACGPILYSQSLPIVPAYIYHLIVLVDTPVYEVGLRQEILSCLEDAISQLKSPEKYFYPSSLIRRVISQGRSEQNAQCLEHIFRCFILLKNMPIPRGGSPKKPELPADQTLEVIWATTEHESGGMETNLTTVATSEEDNDVRRELEEFFISAFLMDSPIYAEACASCWPAQILPALWNNWLDQLILLVDNPEDEKTALNNICHIFLQTFLSPAASQSMGYLFSPLIELIKISLWREDSVTLAELAAQLILGVCVPYFHANPLIAFKESWNELISTTTMLKRSSPVSLGPLFNSSEFSCYRIIVDHISLSGLVGSVSTALVTVPTVLKFCEANIMDCIHLYNSVGFVGKDVLAELKWCNSLLQTANRHLSAPATSVLYESLFEGIWQIALQKFLPILQEVEPLYLRTLANLPDGDEGRLAWGEMVHLSLHFLLKLKRSLQIEDKIETSDRLIESLGLGASIQELGVEASEYLVSTVKALSPSTVMTESRSVTLMLLSEIPYDLTNKEIIEQLIYRVASACDSKEKVVEELSERAIRVWQDTKDTDLLDAMVRTIPNSLGEACAKLSPGLPPHLVESLICKYPERFFESAYRADFVGLSLWAALVDHLFGVATEKSLKVCYDVATAPNNDLERFKILIFLLITGDEVDISLIRKWLVEDESMNRAAYAWHFGTVVGSASRNCTAPILGCPASVSLGDGRWLCEHRSLIEAVDLATFGEVGFAHWLQYKRRREALHGIENSDKSDLDECADLILGFGKRRLSDCLAHVTSRLSRGLLFLNHEFFTTENKSDDH